MPSAFEELLLSVWSTIEDDVASTLGPWGKRDVHKLVRVVGVDETDRVLLRSVSESSWAVVEDAQRGEGLRLSAFRAEVLGLREHAWTKVLHRSDLANLRDARTKEYVRERVMGWAGRAATHQLASVVRAVTVGARRAACTMELREILPLASGNGDEWRLVLPAGTRHLSDELKAWLAADGYVVLPRAVAMPPGWLGIIYGREPATLTRLQAFDLTLSWDWAAQPDAVELRLRERYALVPGTGVGAIALVEP